MTVLAKESPSDGCACAGRQPSNMPPDNPVRRVDFTDIEALGERLAQDGKVMFCRCMASKSFPYCDGSHVELNKQGVTSAGPVVVKALPLPAVSDTGKMGVGSAAGQACNMPPDNPMRRVDFQDIEEIQRRFAQDGKVSFCRCFASKQFPFCDGSHVQLNKEGITNAGPLVIKAPDVPKKKLTPWGSPMPEVCPAIKSGNGSLENVGVKTQATWQCVDCMQKLDSQKDQELHMKYMHALVGI